MLADATTKAYRLRIAVLASRLADQVDTSRVPRDACMVRLFRYGDAAAQERLDHIRDLDMAWWRLLTFQDRVYEAYAAAESAMIALVLSELLLPLS